MTLAFVLLDHAELPTAGAVVKAFDEFALGHGTLRAGKTDADPKIPALSFDLQPGGTALVVLLPRPVPNGEADEAARFSISSFGTGWKLPTHRAQLVVTLQTPAGSNVGLHERLSAFTSFLAALVSASKAVGVYWGDAGATHDPAYFLASAKNPDDLMRLTLWTGVSIAREPDGRLSFLSLGMKQLDLPDLLLVGPAPGKSTEMLETFFDLLGYVVDRGTPLPDGDTVGRSAEERLPVHYVPSPLDSATKVWRVEMRGT